jgi:hypothetical protein
LNDARDLGGELRDLDGDRGAVGRRERAVVVLDGELADTLEDRVHLVQRAFCRLHHGDAVERVLMSLRDAVDLGAHLLGDREAGCVVGGAVDPQAGRQLLHRLLQHALRAFELPMGVERLDVGVDPKRHCILPDVITRHPGELPPRQRGLIVPVTPGRPFDLVSVGRNPCFGEEA